MESAQPCHFVASERLERVKKGISQEDFMEKKWYTYKELRRSSSEEAGRPSLLLPLHPQKTGVGPPFCFVIKAVEVGQKNGGLGKQTRE